MLVWVIRAKNPLIDILFKLKHFTKPTNLRHIFYSWQSQLLSFQISTIDFFPLILLFNPLQSNLLAVFLRN